MRIQHPETGATIETTERGARYWISQGWVQVVDVPDTSGDDDETETPDEPEQGDSAETEPTEEPAPKPAKPRSTPRKRAKSSGSTAKR